MATKDVRGILRPGMFEKIDLPDSDAKLVPVSGRGHYMNMKAEGPDASTPSWPSATNPEAIPVRTANRHNAQYNAEERGAVKRIAPSIRYRF